MCLILYLKYLCVIILERIYDRTGSLGKDLSKISISESNTQLIDEFITDEFELIGYDKFEFLKLLKK